MELIQGVKVKELKVIPDQRGRLMEMLRADDEIFSGFGQVYLTTTLPGVVKAWHLHKKQTDNIVCVAGMIRLGVYDDRPDSPPAARPTSSSSGCTPPAGANRPWALPRLEVHQPGRGPDRQHRVPALQPRPAG